MRKFFLLLLFAILCGQHLVYGQRGFDSLPESSIHIKFGDLIRLDSIEEAESYKFLFSLYGHVDTIQTARPYVAVSEYEGILSTFETYIVEVLYYTGEEWLYSNKSMQVMLVTDSGTDHLIHDLLKAGAIPINAIRGNRELENPEDPECTETGEWSEIEIPIVYHVIVPSWFDGEPTDYLSPAKINQSMNILNRVFAGETGELGVDTKIRFKPAANLDVDFCGETYYGITYNTYNGENNINLDPSVTYPGSIYFPSTNNSVINDYYDTFSPYKYVNIWVFEEIVYSGTDEVFGITSSPCLSEVNIPMIGLIKDVVGENEHLRSRQLGYCVAHEMGHYFGLLHAWIERITIGEITYDVIDGIPDTPDALGPVTGCDYSQLSRIPYDNIMSYTPDGCRYRFTKDQATHMRRSICETFGNYSEVTNIATVTPQEDILDMRIISPISTILCGNNYYDIKIMMSDISLFESIEIEGNDDFEPLIFDNQPEPITGEENTYAIHIQLDQNLPSGNYNFILHTDCASVSKQYNVIACDNNVDMQNAQWYFDSYVTLDFRSGIAELGDYSAMDAHSSESGICDEDGNILFYTDGDKIWNSSHEIIDELNQNVEDIVYRGTIALKFDNNHYAVVTLCNNGHLYSRLLDGQGNIISTSVSEYSGNLFFSGLTAIPCTTGGFWLVSVIETNMGFDIVSLKITLEGTSFSYELGDVLPTANVTDNNRRPVAIKASPDGKYIVCATDGGMKIYYFNATHGNFNSIGCDAGYGNKGASVAFSPSGRFMYLTFLESGVRIFQYDMESDFSCNCNGLNYNVVFSRPNEGEYSNCTLYLQEGPDGRIYFSKDGDAFSLSRTIGVIMEPDNLASTFHGEQDCHVVDTLIDYPIGTILQNRENLPNLIDAKNIDICAPGFSICSEDCSIETLTLHNFSLSPSLTWTIYDLDGRYLTSSNEIQPDLSTLLAPYNNYFAFIIEQKTGPGCNKTMRDTISFNAQMHIEGENSICLDGRSYTYSVSLEPSSQIRETIWNCEGFNGDVAFENGRNSDLMITPVASDQNFIITCNIPDGATQFGCPYTASLDVVANPDCSFVANVIKHCDHGFVELTNIIDANLSNYSASIFINGEPQPMSLNGNDNFTFKYKNIYCDIEDYYLLEQIHRQYLNATILVSNNTTNNVTAIEVLIPRTYTSFSIEGVVSPALCGDDQCVLLATVGGGELVDVSSNNIDIRLAEETSAGENIYYLVVHGSDNSLVANILDDVGNTCLQINKDTMPYELREPTFSVLHSDICHAGETGQIIIEMDLPMAQYNHIITATWAGDYEGQTDFELTNGTYTTVLSGVHIGTYTPTVHYTNNCSIPLDPITIDSQPLGDPVPTFSYPSTSYVCNWRETTSLTIEIQNFTGIEDGFVPFAICNGRTYPFEMDTYTTTINDLGYGNYTAIVFYTSTCSADITFTIEVIPPPNPIVSHTDICSEDETASITIEMELQYIENGFTPTATWNNGETTNFSLQEGMTYITTLNNAEAGLYIAEVQYTSYCSMPLENSISIAVSDIDVNYTYISENEVSILLNFDPSLSSYTISITENGITTETTTSQNPYYFVTNINNDVEITTSCGTIPLNFRVSDVAVNLKSEACQESDADISFEISGGTVPYTATFTCGDYTTTQTFNTSGPNVMHVEIMQGEANHLTVLSANGDTYNINLGTIDFISNYAVLETSSLGATYNGGTYIVPTGLTFDHDVTFTNCTIYCAYTDYDDITSTQWTVNSGNTVTFNQCTIMAGCPDKMWQGIKVIGETITHIDPPLPPLPNDPTDERTRAIGGLGKVICQDGTTIEDAIKAIESIRSGKIIANGSHFNNNQYDLYYNSYVFAQGSATAPTITNCTFTTTRQLNDNRIHPTAHISMKGTSGMFIRGCTFENTLPFPSTIHGATNTGYNRGMGIEANTSHIDVSSSCSFKKLFHGVHASGFKSKAVVVENSSFTGNHRAIYINNNDGCKVLNNNIVSRGEPGEQYEIMSAAREDREVDYSVFIGSCHTFTFEQNTISNATTGLYVYNSGSLGNRVRYNTFEGRPDERTFQLGLPIATKPQYNAIVVVGKNSDYEHGSTSHVGRIGLEVLCNTFRRNTRDIFIKDGYMRREQGSYRAPTGNSFRSADLTGSHKQILTQFSNTSMSNQYDVYTRYEYYQHDEIGTPQITHQLKSGYYDRNKVRANIVVGDYYNESYCQCSDGTGPVVNPNPYNPIPFPGIDRTKSHIQQLGITLDSAVNEYETKLDGGNTANALMKVSAITQATAPSIEDLPQDGYLSDTVCKALVAKVEENPVYVTSVFVENSPLPTGTYEDVQDAEISNILKTVLYYYQSGENKRVADEKAIGDIKQEISLNENQLYDKALNDSLSDTDYAIILGYFNAKTDIDSKIMACNILTSSENYDEARLQISSIRSLGTTEAINCADVMDMYINTMDTTMTKEMLKAHQSQLENLIADDNYLYSGIATALYEYAFDTIIPEYTPIYEDEFTAKSTKTETAPEIYPYAIYPNPTSDFINIELAGNVLDDDIIEFLKHYGINNIEDCETIQINIFDVNSRLVSTGKYKYDTLISIDVSEYTSGTYMVEIRSCFNDVMQTKVVKL